MALGPDLEVYAENNGIDLRAGALRAVPAKPTSLFNHQAITKKETVK